MKRQKLLVVTPPRRANLSDYLNQIKAALDQQDYNKAKRLGGIASKKLASLEHSPLEEYLLYSRLGHSHYLLAQYSFALDAFYKAFLIAQKNSLHPAYQNYISAQMGDILRLIGNISQALRQFEKVGQYYKQYGDGVSPMNKQLYGGYLLSLVGCYLHQGKPDKAKNIITISEADDSLSQTQMFLMDYNHFKGEYLILVEEYNDSRETFLKCIEICKQNNDQCGWLQASIHLAQIDLIEEKISNAIKLLNIILKSARQLKLNDLICESGLLLSKCYLLKGLPDKAIAMEQRIKPILSKLDTAWLYEKTREFEKLYRQLSSTGGSRLAGQSSPKPLPVPAAPAILVKTLNHRYETSPYKEMVIGSSELMREVFQLIEKIAPSDLPILIQGETGTGKELITRAIHAKSQRAEKVFLAFNCGAIPESLMESALFGHTRGAFTGATEDKKGYIELASGGTLFIDEVGNMSVGMQQKLLRVLEENLVWRIGAQKQVSVNTRFIFASNQNVEQLVQRKLFREDLFYRINTIVLNLPSLKERQDDIPLLIEHFLKKYATGMQNVELGVGNEKFRIPDSTLRILMDYSWPGNIRELENEIQRICVLHPEAKIITELMLSESIRTCMSTSLSIAKDILTLKEIEQNSIVEALKRCNGNMTKTAGQLGLTRAGLYRKMKRLGIKPSLVTIS